MSTKTQTPEQLREQAEKLAQQAAEAQAKVDAASLAEYEREQEDRRKADQKHVETFDASAFDRNVDEAYERLKQAVAESPLVQAQAAYIAAQYVRNHAHLELMSARARLGLPAGNARHSGTTDLDMQELTETATQREAQRQVEAWREEQGR